MKHTVSGTKRELLSTDRGEVTVIWELPSSGEIDACKQDLDEKVLWAGFSEGETLFATVTEQCCRLWDPAQLTVVRSVQFEGFYRTRGCFHPDGEHLLVSCKEGVLVYDLQLQHIVSHQGTSLARIVQLGQWNLLR